jgi:hypothetical protein
MRRCGFLGVMALGALLPGCIWQGSIHPFVGDGDCLDLPGLAGVWEEEGSESGTLEFSGEASRRWELLMGGRPGEPAERFVVRIGRIGGTLVWDLTPAAADGAAGGVTSDHLLRLHSCAALRLEGDRLEVRLLDPSWVANEVREGRLDLRYEELREGDRTEGVVLTAPASELKAFLEEHLDDDGALGEATVFFRRRPEP